MSVLTAAVQYPGVPEKLFNENPIDAALQATEIWIDSAREIGLDGIQLAAALAKPDAYIPLEQMLHPVASHGPWRTLPDGSGTDLTQELADRIVTKCRNGEREMKIFDIGFFENLLHPNPVIRCQIHLHLLRCARAAKMLEPVGCKGVTTFIGADTSKSIDENLILFRDYVVPLLKKFDELGLTLWIENCPMPGWTPAERYMQNIACTPFMWVVLNRIADSEDVGHVLRITYDASHSILIGSRPLWDFMYLEAMYCQDMVDRFHGKDQNRNLAKIAAHGFLGQRAGTGIFNFSTEEFHSDPKILGNAWKRMTASHTLPGLSDYNAEANYKGLKVDWLEHQIGARDILGIKPSQSVFHIEHEWDPARDQNLQRVLGAIERSTSITRGFDMAADGIVESRSWCKENGLPWETTFNSLKEILDLDNETVIIDGLVK